MNSVLSRRTDGEHGEHPAAQPQRIAYVMSRFPKVTETFILREMIELERLGWRVTPFALIREREQVPHPGVDQFTARTHFGAARSGRTLLANLAACACQPGRYTRLLWRTLRHCWCAPRTLARSLICFPVAVRWAAVARRDGVAHIHAHFATHAAYMAYVMAELAGIDYSFTAHAHDLYLDQTMLAEKVRRAALVVPISEYNRRLLLRLCPEAAAKIQVVYGGVDPQTFAPTPLPPAHISETGRLLRILTVARLAEYKGIAYLVEACRLLKDRDTSFQCTIIGDGPDRAALEAAIARHGLQERVALLSWLPSQRVAEHLGHADVFVLPSVMARDGMMEGLPTVLIEAQSCGLPVVSTMLSGIPELVRHGENGLLVPPRDASALAAALSFLAAHPEERARMGRAGRRRVTRDFDLTTNTQQKALLFAAAPSHR